MKTVAELFVIVALVSMLAYGQRSSKSEPMYLGQQPPGLKASLFAPDIVSTGMGERDIAMSPDGKEIYFGLAFGRYATIMVTRYRNGKWTEPETAPFTSGLQYLDYEPALSANGKRVFFLSTRPPKGQSPKPGWGHQNIWAADRKPDGSWDEPYDLGNPINTDDGEFYPSLTNDGTLYFTRSGNDDKSKIYRSRYSNGKYGEPELLPKQINGFGDIFNTTISRDESMLIACTTSRDTTRRKEILYYVFYRSPDDTWSEGVPLGEEINRPGGGAAQSVSISADGKYLFFASRLSKPINEGKPKTFKHSELMNHHKSAGNGFSDIYWIDINYLKTMEGR